MRHQSTQNRPKSRRKFKLEIVFVGISFIWIIICTQLFYKHQQHQLTINIGNAPNATSNTTKKSTHDENSGNTASAQSTDNDAFPDHHMVFSTACSSYQDWQSFLFFYHAHKVSQPGRVTRIASGAPPDSRNNLSNFTRAPYPIYRPTLAFISRPTIPTCLEMVTSITTSLSG